MKAALQSLPSGARDTLLDAASSECHLRRLTAVVEGKRVTVFGGPVGPADPECPALHPATGTDNDTAAARDPPSPWTKISLRRALELVDPKDVGFGDGANADAHSPNFDCGAAGVAGTAPCCGLANIDSYLYRWKEAIDRPAAGVAALLAERGIVKLAVLGDSVAAQWANAFTFMLARDGVPCRQGPRFDETAPGIRARLPWLQGWHRWLICGKLHLLSGLPYGYTWLNKTGDVLRELTGDFSWAVDAISFNAGLHFDDPTHNRSIEPYLAYALPLLQRFAEKPGKLGIFRETAAQHFPGMTTGSYEGRTRDFSRCARGRVIPGARQIALTNLVPSRFDAIVVETFFAATMDRGDMHLGKNAAGLDCSHFCFNPLFWQGIFSNLHAVLGRWAATNHDKKNPKFEYIL